MKLYLETSVWSYLLADHLPDKQAATRELIDQKRAVHEFFVSALVIEELSRTRDEDRRGKLLQAIQEAEPMNLPPVPEVVEISGKILDLGILTERSQNDAIHIAFAIVHGMDAVVSWDTRHIVRLKTKRGISAVCRLFGYREVEVVTPEEV